MQYEKKDSKPAVRAGAAGGTDACHGICRWYGQRSL